jgi:hypothetical protein
MIYIVTEKATGKEVCRYESTAPVEWNGMEFATHDHAEFIEPVDPNAPIEGVASRILTKREFIKRFTVEEYAGIKAAATVNATLDYYWQMFMLAEEINTGDADTVAGVQMLEQAGLIAAGRAEEILHG